MTVDAMKDMEVGQIVDYVIEYNRIHDPEHKDSPAGKQPDTVRKATQADWDALLG